MTTVIIIVIYGITVIQVNFNAEKRSQELVQELVQVPFVSPDVVFDEKVSQFFTALDKVFAELKTKADLSTYGDVFVFLYVPVSAKES
jgi:ABC-type spermidine/putrescine transport system permease subunit II